MKSIVIRGSICFDSHNQNYLQEVINSIRSWFKDEIIISTWKNQEEHLYSICGYDKIILSEDPGPGPIQHIKRQITSYKNGIAVCEGDEIMVIRSDIKINTDPFNFLFKFNKKPNDNLNIFKKKIIIFNMMSIIPESFECPNTFRLCDWLHVGDKEDIKLFGEVLSDLNQLDLQILNVSYSLSNTCTEKLWLMLVLKNKIKDTDIFDTKSIDKYCWDFIINNFIILNTKSTLNAMNLNWQFQPENLNCYITQQLYEQKYSQMLI